MNNNTKLMALAISILSNDEKFSYSKTSKMFSKVSSYQVKRILDKKWDEQKELKKYITSLLYQRTVYRRLLWALYTMLVLFLF